MDNEEGIPDAHGGSSLELTQKLTPTAMVAARGAGTGVPTRALRRWVVPPADEVQRALPQYEVAGFIARGGMGAVYKGVQKALKRTVAIKMLPAEIVDDDLDFVGRFKREAQAMATLSHPNIVTVFEAGETAEGLLYFVMEYVDGTDVGELLAEQGRLAPEEALRITGEVLAALECAHSHGIVHRDIKPSNILISNQGRVKVADFGLAKVAAADGGLTQSVVTVGTPDFLAPETYIPGVVLDQRADIYSAGVMLYKMLTGNVPRGRFDAPSGEVRGMDPRLDRIIDRAMQSDREKRYETAREMRLEVEGLASRPVGQPETTNGVIHREAVRKPQDEKSSSRRKVLRGSAFAAVIGVIATVGWWIGEGTQSDSSVPNGKPSHTTHWRDAFTESPLREAIANTRHTAQGYRLPEANHWTVNPRSLKAGAIRVRATSEGGHFVSLYIFLDDGKGHRIRFKPQTNQWIRSYGTADSGAVDFPIEGVKTCSDGQPHELLLVRSRGLIRVFLDGALLHEASDPSTVPGRFGLDIFLDAQVSTEKVEYLDLENVSQTDELRLLGIEEKGLRKA